ncbi:MAG: xanthine dehydrogenase family protein molybdopterin-binding subunit, partial [Actinomycetota bacterium]|nr:xanthine dehydrogenase family protein molybdopterin-binding subunit [Actinomycetota bacterium]
MAIARLPTEDEPMLRGSLDYTADLPLSAGALHAVFVRAHDAHGILRGVDTAGAKAAPGVVEVVTAEELGIEPHSYYPATTADGLMARPLLATERIRFAGEPVAIVLAESVAAALDAAELVAVDVDPLPALIDPEAAAADAANLLFPAARTNIVVPLEEARDPDPLANADVVV